MMKWQRDNAIPVAQARKVRPEELVGKIVYGELWCCERPEYTQQYAAIIERARGKEK
jgi:2-oxoglutarate ferredoxin oxidoreductase subunit beta